MPMAARSFSSCVGVGFTPLAILACASLALSRAARSSASRFFAAVVCSLSVTLTSLCWLVRYLVALDGLLATVLERDNDLAGVLDKSIVAFARRARTANGFALVCLGHH